MLQNQPQWGKDFAGRRKKNSCVDHKATEMISLFTGGSPATL